MTEPLVEVNREYVELALKAAQQFGDKQQEMVLESWLEVQYDCKVLADRVKELEGVLTECLDYVRESRSDMRRWLSLLEAKR